MLAAGMKFGPYEIVSSLGAGGMGEVYRARDSRLGRDVALKVLASHRADIPAAVARFEREARTVAALSHPAIVALHDVGREQGRFFIITELLEGETLRQRLDRGPLPWRRVAEIGATVAEALAAAHAKGVIHRDLKPENIFVTRDGHVKVLDFGLAQLKAPDVASAATTVPGTDPGVVVGTAGYMSPEQVRGEAIDARTDIFAIGCVLYEAVTGERAFRRSTTVETMAAILNEEPRPAADSGRDVPPNLNLVITHCLEKQPDHRFQSARDLAFALRSALSTSSAGVMPPASGRQRSHAVLVTAAVLGLIVAAAAYLRFRPDAPASAPLELWQQVKLTQLSNDGNTGPAAISPDGRYLAYVITEAGRQSLWIRQLASGSTLQITAPGEIASEGGVTFSPDGNYIYYVTFRDAPAMVSTIYRVPAIGGTPKAVLRTTIGDGLAASGIAVSPDGTQLAFQRFWLDQGMSALVIVNADGTSERTLMKGNIAMNWTPAWSPDGKTILLPVRRGSVVGLTSYRVRDGVEQAITDRTWRGVIGASWTPDGKALLLIAHNGGPRQIWHVSLADGTVRPVTNDANDYGQVSMTTDGTTMAAVTLQRESSVWIAERDPQTVPRRIVSGASRQDGASGVAWTPDGRVLYTTSRTAGRLDIAIMNGDGTGDR